MLIDFNLQDTTFCGVFWFLFSQISADIGIRDFKSDQIFFGIGLPCRMSDAGFADKIFNVSAHQWPAGNSQQAVDGRKQASIGEHR